MIYYKGHSIGRQKLIEVQAIKPLADVVSDKHNGIFLFPLYLPKIIFQKKNVQFFHFSSVFWGKGEERFNCIVTQVATTTTKFCVAHFLCYSLTMNVKKYDWIHTKQLKWFPRHHQVFLTHFDFAYKIILFHLRNVIVITLKELILARN